MKNQKDLEIVPLAVIDDLSSGTTKQRRERIEELEEFMLSENQLNIPVLHRFLGDMYAREIIIPKGTLLTGRIHKFDHFDIMVSGDITVSTDEGGPKRMKGFHFLDGKAGKKRAGYAHEDTRWITFHSAEERSPEDMYDFLTCGSFAEFESFMIDLAKTDYKLLSKQEGGQKCL